MLALGLCHDDTCKYEYFKPTWAISANDKFIVTL